MWYAAASSASGHGLAGRRDPLVQPEQPEPALPRQPALAPPLVQPAGEGEPVAGAAPGHRPLERGADLVGERIDRVHRQRRRPAVGSVLDPVRPRAGTRPRGGRAPPRLRPRRPGAGPRTPGSGRASGRPCRRRSARPTPATCPPVPTAAASGSVPGQPLDRGQVDPAGEDRQPAQQPRPPRRPASGTTRTPSPGWWRAGRPRTRRRLADVGQPDVERVDRDVAAGRRVRWRTACAAGPRRAPARAAGRRGGARPGRAGRAHSGATGGHHGSPRCARAAASTASLGVPSRTRRERQRRDPPDHLAGQVQRFAAGRQHPGAPSRCASTRLTSIAVAPGWASQVSSTQQAAPVGGELAQRVDDRATRLRAQAQRRRDRDGDQARDR